MMKKSIDAEKAIEHIAMREKMAPVEIRRQMRLAVLAGLCNQDPEIQARWRKIPCKGDVPTPEEVIMYLATHINAGIKPF